MRRFVKCLRIVFSATCVIACVLLIVLWVRSYQYRDGVFRNGNRCVTMLSECGDIVFQTFKHPDFNREAFWDMTAQSNPTMSPDSPKWIYIDPKLFHLRIPHWFLIELSA